MISLDGFCLRTLWDSVKYRYYVRILGEFKSLQNKLLVQDDLYRNVVPGILGTDDERRSKPRLLT